MSRSDPLLSSFIVNPRSTGAATKSIGKRNSTVAKLDENPASLVRADKRQATESDLVDGCLLSDHSTDFWSPQTTVRKYYQNFGQKLLF